MKAARLAAAALVLLALSWAVGTFTAEAQVNGNDNRIAVMDDCLPGDPAWNATGGCTLLPHQGDVSNAEFTALLRSPLTIPSNAALIGHPSWRMEPSHVTVEEGKTVPITNNGGRGHTFTRVENFGGGFVAPLNIGMLPAPECTPATTVPLPGGARDHARGLQPGLNKFQCCIHPWMRATIRVE